MEEIMLNALCQSFDSFDFVKKEMELNGFKIHLLYLDTLIDKKQLDLFLRSLFCGSENKSRSDFFAHALNLKHNNTANEVKGRQEAIDGLIRGGAVLLFDKLNRAICYDFRNITTRGISEPTDENVLKGSKDCFIEPLVVNIATIRSKIASSDLCFKRLTLGVQTKTAIAVGYIKGITNMGLVDEVVERITRINEDGALSPAVLEEGLSTRKYSIFPLSEYTERPDKLCANLLEGRIAIIVDGLPTVYIVPAVFNGFMQAAEDYSFNFLFSSTLRIIRYLCLFMAIFLPAFYIAVTSFHPEMIPSSLAFAIIKAKENVPFPSFVEVFFMLFAFELLQEAGLRLPKTIGQAVSIVGGLIIGEAAVSAKLLSPAVIVVVALAGISSFTIPKQDLTQSIRILRIVLAIFAALAGFVGVSIASICVALYLCSLESFNVPYLAPYVSSPLSEVFTDTFIRQPLHLLKRRPSLWGAKNTIRKAEKDS